MKYLKLDRFREGMKVTCILMGKIISDAKLHYEQNRWFICQNIEKGLECKNKLGYKYSFTIGSGEFLKDYQVKRLREAFSLKDKINILKKELNKIKGDGI
jgi:hypothetical protein